jgi:hypothetical protein
MLVIRSAAAPAPVEPGTIPAPPAGLNGYGREVAELFADDLARGEVPGVRRIRREMHLGQPRAQEVREYLSSALTANVHRSGHAALGLGRPQR